MNDEMKFILKDPANELVHIAMQHPVYSDHYVTRCGQVVTTGSSRHETNLIGFHQISNNHEITCKDCQI
ncbi:MAG: hypothetical protein ACFFED_09370 [Candidatus Thorarchaeota archaeon]